jgi:hypothetical protein
MISVDIVLVQLKNATDNLLEVTQIAKGLSEIVRGYTQFGSVEDVARIHTFMVHLVQILREKGSSGQEILLEAGRRNMISEASAYEYVEMEKWFKTAIQDDTFLKDMEEKLR